jgi:propanediol utilization protein
MNKPPETARRKPSPGRGISESMRQAVGWVEGKGVAARMSVVEVPVAGVRQVRLSGHDAAELGVRQGPARRPGARLARRDALE